MSVSVNVYIMPVYSRIHCTSPVECTIEYTEERILSKKLTLVPMHRFLHQVSDGDSPHRHWTHLQQQI